MSILPLVRAARWAIADSYLRAIVAIARDGHGSASGLADAAARRDARAQRRQASGVLPAETLPGTYSVTLYGTTAVIPIDGPIFRRANLFMDVSGGTSTEYLTHDVRAALESARVQSIMLLVDSPGGEAKGIHELAQLLYAGRDQKPIHCYTDGDCCSGAYWLAAACSRITLDDSALIGSIGVVLTVDDPQHPINDDGTIEIVSSMADLKRPDPHSDAGRAALQTIVDDLGWLFVERVAAYRGLTRETITAVRGGVLVGQRAIDAQFADALGSFATALDACQQAARDASGGLLAERRAPMRAAQEETPMALEDTQLLAAALGADDGAEARLTARLHEMEQRIAAHATALDAQQAAIADCTAQLATATASLAAETAARTALATRVAELEGDAPTVISGFRASTAGPVAPEHLAAAMPDAPSPLDAFLTRR